jgi:hypothetical protein
VVALGHVWRLLTGG